MVAAIPRLTVELEVVTPLFLGGAESKTGLAELRPPSVRGALRFWWRAWHQAREPSANADELFHAESEVFGSTDSASPLVVRLSGEPRRMMLGRAESPAGFNYLMYGMHERQGGHGQPVRMVYRPAFALGRAETNRFKVTLSPRPRLGGPTQLPDGALAALWCLCNLGGLGARVARGAGAVHVTKVEGEWPEALPPLNLGAHSPQELQQKLAAALRQLLGPTPANAPTCTNTPSLRSSLARVCVYPKQWELASQALEEVGEGLRQYRLTTPGSDYFAVKQFISRGTVPATVRRAAFGLPLPFYYRSLPDGMQEGKKATVTGGKGFDRSASPLHLRVVPLAPKGYAVVMLIFRVPLLPQGQQLQLKSDMYSKHAPVPDQSIIDEYIASLRAQYGNWLEVNYA